MALEFAAGSFTWSSADGLSSTYTVSGLSFQPKAIRFYTLGNNAGSNNVVARSGARCVGFAVSTSSRRCVAAFSLNASASMACGSAAFDDCCMAIVDSTAVVGKLDITAFNSDGFVLTIDDASSITAQVFWEAWGGTDITVAQIGDITEPAATGNVDYTVTGFTSGATDQVVMFAGVQSVSALNTWESQDSGFHVGFAASTTAADNVTVVGNNDTGSASADCDGYCQDGECLSMITIAGGNPNARAVLTTFGANNFRLNWIARATTGRRSIFLAIKGGKWKSGALTINGNSASATATLSGLSFAPIGMSLIGRMTAKNTAGTATAQDRMSLGTGVSTSSRQAQGYLDLDGAGTSDVNLSGYYDQVLVYNNEVPTLITAYDINAMNSDGFQLIVDTAGGVASEWIGYLTFGNVPQLVPARVTNVSQAVNRASRF